MPQEVNTLSAKLRQMADAIEDIGITNGRIYGETVEVWTYSAEAYAAMVSKVNRSAFTETGEKHATDYASSVEFPLTVDKNLFITVYTQRANVCRKVQTGTIKVMKTDPNAPKVEMDEPVYEWECSSILAQSAESESTDQNDN